MNSPIRPKIIHQFGQKSFTSLAKKLKNIKYGKALLPKNNITVFYIEN